MAGAIGIILVTTAIFIQQKYNTKAATYNWNQVDWSGGVSASSADHESNQSGWTNYASKDSNLSAGSNLSLTTDLYSLLDTSDTDFGSAESLENLEVSGTGAAAYLNLTTGAAATAVADQTMAVGEGHACVIMADSSVKCWGYNGFGQLGDGSTVDSTVPVAVSGISNATAVAVGGFSSCALLADSSVKCWGSNNYGQLGDGTTTDRATPVAVSGISNATAIAVGKEGGRGNYACALLADNTIKCWGLNSRGQLGDGSTTNRYTPVAVTGISTATAVSAGDNHTCALLADSTVSCWGYNNYGQLGDGTTTQSLTPVAVTGLTNVSSIAAGGEQVACCSFFGHSCAMLNDGTAKCWGYNNYGQLGDGTTTSSSTPVVVSGLNNIASIAAAEQHSCAVLADNTAKCWGYNNARLGDGTTTSRNTPVAVVGLSNALNIAGGDYSCSLLTDGSVKCWGSKANGRLGDGNDTQSAVPLTTVGITNASMVAEGAYHNCALLTDGSVKCWGANNYGQLGDGTLVGKDTPVLVTGITNAVELVAGGNYNCALLSDNTVNCWGSNGNGQLGDGTTSRRTTPVAVTGLSDVTKITAAGGDNYSGHTCALLSDGSARCWGDNKFGQLGDNTTTDRTTPVVVSGINNATAIAAGGGVWGSTWSTGGHTCALLNDNSVKCWGANNNGQLGDGTTTNSSVPIDVVGIANATTVKTGFFHNCALLADSTIKCWGDNIYGQLGDGTTSDRYTPVAVSGITDAVAVGLDYSYHTCAILADNSAQCWGRNGDGQLGDGTTSNKNSPVTVSGISAASDIGTGEYHSCAVVAAGAVNCWGANDSGQLGSGVETLQLTPIHVSAIGGYHALSLFDSQIFDTTANAEFSSFSMDTTTPVGTSIAVLKARSSNNSDMSGAPNWNECINLVGFSNNLSASNCVTNSDRYIQYHTELSTTDAGQTPWFNEISLGYLKYPSSQSLISSKYNSGDDTNLLAGLEWQEDTVLPTGTSTTLALRSAADEAALDAASWQEIASSTDSSLTSGCSKDANTVSCDISTIPAGMKDGAGDRWYQYRVTLGSVGDNVSTFDQLTVSYVVNAVPEFEAAPVSGQDSDGLVNISYAVRDVDTTTGTTTPGEVTPSFEYSLDNGSTWNDITAGLSAGATLAKAVEEVSYTTYSLSWNAKTQIDGQYTTTAKIRVTVDDAEAANNLASAESAAFVLDTADPTLATVSVDATTVPASLSLFASDDSSLEMRIGLEADLADGEWQNYAISETVILETNPDTGYVQFRDVKGNNSAILSFVTPETPSYLMTQDTSNLKGELEEYRLFIAWKVVAEPAAGFEQYQLYRSEDNENFVLLDTITERAINYYGDASVDFDTLYYYKVASKDSDGNISYLSSAISGKANGAQDAGEGGGGQETTAPVISNVQVSNISTTQALISWDTDELASSTVGYSETAGSFTTEVGVATMTNNQAGLGRHNVVLTGLEPDTSYYFQVKSTDLFDNIVTDNDTGDGYAFTTLAGPVISNVSTSSVGDTTAIVVWETDIEADSYLVYATSLDFSDSSEVGSSSEVTTHAVELSNLTVNTDYYYYVKSDTARDDNQGEYYTFKTSAASALPIISNIQVSDLSYDSATVIWDTDTETNSLVDYGLTVDYGSSFGDSNEMVLDHTVVLPKLNPLTTYYFQVRSRNTKGNEQFQNIDEEGEQLSFTTLSGAVDTNDDGTGEQLSDIVGEIEEMIDTLEYTELEIQQILADSKSLSISSTRPSAKIQDNVDVLIKWETNKKSVGKVVYWENDQKESDAETASETGEFTREHEVLIKNLDPQTKYKYKVISTGALGDKVESDTDSFETEEEPKIRAINISEVTLTGAKVSWVADSMEAVALKYGADTNYGHSLLAEKKAENIYELTLEGLSSGTEYHLKIVGEVTDEETKTVSSDDYSFKTLFAPEISQVDLEDITEETVTVKWDTNVATDSLVKYSLVGQEEGVTVGKLEAVKEHKVKLTNLDAGTEYQIEVISKDRDGNESEHKELKFSTKEDLVPAQIEKVKVENTIFPGKAAQIQTIISWKTSKKGTTIIAYKEKSAKATGELDAGVKELTGKEYQGWNIEQYKDLTNKHVFISTDFKPSTVYHYRIASFDKYGNFIVSENFSLLTPAKQESVFDLIVKNFRESFGWIKNISE